MINEPEIVPWEKVNRFNHNKNCKCIYCMGNKFKPKKELRK